VPLPQDQEKRISNFLNFMEGWLNRIHFI
jgi:hypothetical protein